MIAAVAFAVVGGASPAHALTINYINGGSLSSDMMTGFNDAAAILQNLLTDSVNVNISVSTSTAMSSNVIASTSTARVSYSYATVRSALATNSTSSADASSVAHLQAGPSLNMVTNNQGNTTRVYDTNGSANNTNVLMTTANAKALGLYAANAGFTDAAVTFNSNFSYDFNRSNGISGFDFVGIALHELITALGFISGVDTVDNFAHLGIPTDDTAVLSTLDLFRFSSDSLSHGAGVLDAAVGGNPYFSVDGGITDECNFSTGSFNGNGYQASRWAPGSCGVMQPTAPYGVEINIQQADQDALDLIGWEIRPLTHTDNPPPPPAQDPGNNTLINTQTAPEPASLILFGFGLGALRFARRRRS